MFNLGESRQIDRVGNRQDQAAEGQKNQNEQTTSIGPDFVDTFGRLLHNRWRRTFVFWGVVDHNLVLHVIALHLEV